MLLELIIASTFLQFPIPWRTSMFTNTPQTDTPQLSSATQILILSVLVRSTTWWPLTTDSVSAWTRSSCPMVTIICFLCVTPHVVKLIAVTIRFIKYFFSPKLMPKYTTQEGHGSIFLRDTVKMYRVKGMQRS